MRVTDRVNNMKDGLTKTFGIKYISTDDPNTLEARMTCTEATSQPWGYMSGGAILGLAENLAGVASMCISPDRIVLGINICANHITSIHTGEEAIATAILLRKGNTLHNWLVEVRNAKGVLVSEIQVTNYTIKERRDEVPASVSPTASNV
jgi:1,4-dihydroxy-2-naphthoyl-CoA hydrolase